MYIETQQLGRVRIGFLLQKGGQMTFHWLQYVDGRFQDPLTWKGLLSDMPSNPRPSLVVEAKEGSSEPLWVCFDDPSRGLVKDFAVELSSIGVGGAYRRWQSVENTDSYDAPSFHNFRSNYWSVAETWLTLYTAAGEPVARVDGDAVSGVMAISYREWYREVYQRVVTSLGTARERADLTSPLRSLGLPTLAERTVAAQKATKDSAVLELYLRTEPVLQELVKAVQQIADAPAVRMSPSTSYHDIQPDQVAAFYAQHPHLNVFAIEGVMQLRGRRVPTRFLASQTVETADVPENRYVLWVAHEVDLVFGMILDELDLYLEQKKEERRDHEKILNYEDHIHWKEVNTLIKRHERVRERLVLDRSVLQEQATRLKARDVQPGVAERPNSELFYYDLRYARLKALHEEVQRSLGTSAVTEETAPMRTGSFSQLYQRWCFRRVVEALKSEDVGFEIVADHGRAEDALYGHPLQNRRYCTMRLRDPEHPWRDDLRLEVWYERRYPFADPRTKEQRQTAQRNGISFTPVETYGFENRPGYRSGFSSGGWSDYKHRPDISLEFTSARLNGRSSPRIVTLDPTLSNFEPRLKEKFAYAENLRAFHEEDLGESRQIVVAAWALYPGASDKDSPKPKGPRAARRSQGFCPLHPQNESDFPETLREIIEETVYAELRQAGHED